ncbi:MAG: hypothetical protein NTZ22_09575 [Hyphomicrobiales bacterium]|nr:hypothetical protein [Hyphomicrobiales bacterium]
MSVDMNGAFLTDAHQAKRPARIVPIGAVAQHHISGSQQAGCQWLTGRSDAVNTINIDVDERVVTGNNTGEGRNH